MDCTRDSKTMQTKLNLITEIAKGDSTCKINNDFSYGFRPHRSCHQALDRLDKIIMTKPINHIIDADIKGFFDKRAVCGKIARTVP